MAKALIEHVVLFTGLKHYLGPFEAAVEQALAAHAKQPISDHLEIETYTWDVLPEHLKTGDIVEYVSRELTWVRDQLEQP